jgi:small GTP-binding protein
MARFKAVFIGDSGVGKSCLYSRLDSGTYVDIRSPTVGGSFAAIRVTGTDGQDYTIGLWDTAGQERYKTVIPMYFERVDLILAVFAVNDRSSFDHMSDWISMARGRAYETARVFVIGNKSDVTEGRHVSASELQAFADSIGAVCAIETSAKTGEGLELLKEGIAREVTALKVGFTTEVKVGEGAGVDIGASGEKTETEKDACC